MRFRRSRNEKTVLNSWLMVAKENPNESSSRSVLRSGKSLLVSICFLVVVASSIGQEPKSDQRSLKQVIGDRYHVGVGVGHRVLENAQDTELIKKHFRILTPENCMKPQGIHPAEDKWNFRNTDRFADFARKSGLEMVGHCLVWAKDDRTDQWMMTEPNGEPLTRETLLKRIENHVETVVKRYADVTTMWDVVNEAIGDSQDGLLRDSIYSRTADLDFIVTAFKTARKHDPDALLIYNDYNGHKPGKREKLLKFLKALLAKGAPVDAYGMQGHFELGDDSLPQLQETFDELRKLGLKIVVSELDIDIVKRGKWWAEGGKFRDELSTFDPYKDGLPREIQKVSIDQYVALFQLFDEYQDVIARVSFWNLHDGQSWLNYFPWKRKNYPLLFDRDGQPKPEFDAVYDFLKGPKPNQQKLEPPQSSWHPAIERTDEKSRIVHQQLIEKTKKGKIDIYFQGDSITRRWGATDYPEFLQHWNSVFYGWNAANFAWGGDKTQNMLWRMRNGELDGVTPKAVSLQAGTNNFPWQGKASPEVVEEIVVGNKAIIDEFRTRIPQVPIVLTGLFPRTQNPSLAPAIAAVNVELKKLADADPQIHWIDISEDLTDPRGRLLPGVSSDGLHLEKAGYQIWAKALVPVFEKILGPRAELDQAPPATGDPG